MAIMTGSLRDFSYQRLNYRNPRITFTPSGPGVRSDVLFATPPVRVTPDEEGAFSVNLEPTAGIAPQVWYKITIEWSDSSGNFISQDNPDWVLVVPFGGGSVAKNIAVVTPERIITKGEPGDASAVTVEAARGAAADAIAAADVLYANDPRALRSVESQEYAIPFLDESGYVAGGVQKDASFNFEKAPRVAGEAAVTLAPINDLAREWAIPFVDADGYVAGGIRRDGTAEFFKLKGGGGGGSAVDIANEMAGFSKSSRTRISAVGDSLTNGYFDGAGGKTADSYPTKLQALLPAGVTVFNLSTSGWTTDEVAVRIGALPLPLTLAGGSIPASGSVDATTTATVGWGTAARAVNGTLAGVPGRLSRAEGATTALSFQRTTAGTAVTVPAGTVFVPDFAGHEGDTVVILLGRNDVFQNVRGSEATVAEHVAASIDRIVDWMAPTVKHVLILTPTTTTNEVRGTSGYTTVTEIGAKLTAKYPSRVYDLRGYLVKQAIYDLGITPTAADLEKMAGDTLPPSIMDPGDNTHYSRATAALVAARVHDYITTRGWV